MIRREFADAYKAAQRERNCRPLRFFEKQLLKVGDALTPEEDEAFDDLSVNGGRAPNRVDGFTPLVRRYADAYAAYVEMAGEDMGQDGEARDIVSRKLGIKDHILIDVLMWARGDVNLLLTERGFVRPKRRRKSVGTAC